MSMFGGVVGRRGVPSGLAIAAHVCDALRRLTWFLLPANSLDVDLLVAHPIVRLLPLIKAATRDLVRELNLTSYEGLGRLMPPIQRALIIARQRYASNQEIRQGLECDGGRVSLLSLTPGWWYQDQGGALPPVLSGPYDVDADEGPYTRRVNSNYVTSMLTSLAGYDVLVNSGIVFRPLAEGHHPVQYLGAYGKYGLPGETRPYLSKTGEWGTDCVFRKEEGDGMRYHVNFEEYREERKAAEADGVDLEAVRVGILGGWRRGVSWGDGEE
eukprot:scaffold85009_cov36-Cyclotella_meneghiniana.AAC.2